MASYCQATGRYLTATFTQIYGNGFYSLSDFAPRQRMCERINFPPASARVRSRMCERTFGFIMTVPVRRRHFSE